MCDINSTPISLSEKSGSKTQFNKNIRAPIHYGRTSFGSNKSFKPQLEDIKSSLLLLNNKPIDRNVKITTENGKWKELNENERKAQLTEAKQKYITKKFWNDSKYDKIEGLNWISWK